MVIIRLESNIESSGPKELSNNFNLHELGVVSSVDYYAVHPLSVSQLGSSQQDLVWSQGYGAVVRTIRVKAAFTSLHKERTGSDKASVKEVPHFNCQSDNALKK